MKTGDRVIIECDGRKVPGYVTLMSGNEMSGVLSFEAILDGHVGLMPILKDDDGQYRSLMTGILVKVRTA